MWWSIAARSTNPAIEPALLRALEQRSATGCGRTRFRRYRSCSRSTAADAAYRRPSASRPIPSSAIHARASHSPDRLPLLFDGDRDTRWLTGERQTGDEWIELELDRAAQRQRGADADRRTQLRRLSARARDRRGRGRRRPDAISRDRCCRSSAAGWSPTSAIPCIDIRLPDNQARIIRLRQLGTTDQLFWSIHELELRERDR